MSVCPVPPKTVKTDYSNPGSFSASAPDPKFEVCLGGTTSVITGPGQQVTTVVCCPSPGPAGPTGAAGRDGDDGINGIDGQHGAGYTYVGDWQLEGLYIFESGDPVRTHIVQHKGSSYVALQSHQATGATEPGVGADWRSHWGLFSGGGGTGSLNWAGSWMAPKDYKINDVVMGTDGNAFVCIVDHTSQLKTNEPNLTGSLVPVFENGEQLPNWATYWEEMTDIGVTADAQSQGIFSKVWDWAKDRVKSGDWLQLALAGAGVVWAGSVIVDKLTDDGKTGRSEPAASTYNGSAGFNGTFTGVALPAVVARVMEYAGYSPAQYDTSQLPNTRCDFTINSATQLRGLLINLSLVYQFDVVPSGEVIKFVPKYAPTTRTMTYADLGHSTGPYGTGVPYTARRYQGIDLPRSISLTYYSKELDGKQFTQIATLDSYQSGQDAVISVPLTLTDAEAHRIAETALVNAHMERQEYQWVTDYHNIDLEVGDVVTLPIDSGSTTVRLTQIVEREDGLLEMTGVRSDYNNVSYQPSGNAIINPPAQTINRPVEIGYSDTIMVEVPPVTADDSSPRIYAIIHGFNADRWPGAAVYRSVDGGATYDYTLESSAIVTWGVVATALPSANHYVWDTSTNVTVTLKQGMLTSQSDSAVLNGKNWAMIGQELVGFANVTPLGDNTYRLSRLLRGRRGSEPHVSTHVNNELFVLMDDNVTRFDYPMSDINKPIRIKTVTHGSDLSKADGTTVQSFAVNMIPWRVAHPKALRQANNDWNISWVERVRLDGGLRDSTEITRDGDWAGYALAILDSTTDQVKRTFMPLDPNWTYTSAMQMQDFGALQTNIKVSVSQMSKVVGSGYPHVFTG